MDIGKNLRCDSVSSDKLMLLIEAAGLVPKATLDRVQTFKLSWQAVGTDPAIVPFIEVTFKE